MKLWPAALFLLAAGPAFADDLAPICSDRPGHATAACTVDPRHVQVESALFDETFTRRTGTTTDFTQAGMTVLKYGVSDAVDVEAALPMFQNLRLHDATGTTNQTGIGDLLLKAKWNPLAGQTGSFGMVFTPYIKLPTAGAGMSNGAVEGGLLMPQSLTLGDGWSLFNTPEVDVLQNAAGDGTHVNLADDLSIGYAIGSVLLGADVYMIQSFDPGPNKPNWYLADANIGWFTDNDTMLDLGAAAGLNRATPDLEIYVGISRRF